MCGKFRGVARVDGVSVAEATYAAMIMDHKPGDMICPDLPVGGGNVWKVTLVLASAALRP